MSFIGIGTIVNVIAVLLGAGIGILVGNRLPNRVREAITDVLGIFTAILGAQSLRALFISEFVELTKAMATVVILLSLLIGTLVGSALDLEGRLDRFGGWLQHRMASFPVFEKIAARSASDGAAVAREKFVNGFVTAFLVWCIGPLAMLGSLNEGLGNGAEMLYLKSSLDFFSAVAFASLFGLGVMVAALPLAIYQLGITGLGWAVGDILPQYAVDAMTITGGVMLLALSLRILGIKNVRVSDLSPALLLAPLGAWLAIAVG